MEIPRSEYPRPTLVREDWVNLNGTWEFDFDDSDRGLQEQWFAKHDFSRSITVPFTFESVLSGIGDSQPHEVVWYRRAFRIPDAFSGRRIMLNFGAADYRATVWVNGMQVCKHRGGFTPFQCDITDALKPQNYVVVRIEDRMSKDQPRGKQHWELKSSGCHYTRATGIWQTVWLEPVSVFNISGVRFYPDVSNSRVRAVVQLSGRSDATQIRARFSFEGAIQAEVILSATGDETTFEIGLPNAALWTPESPNLYNVMLEVRENDVVLDRALAYFGMRNVTIENGKIMLNNAECYLRFVLDQGYFPEGVYTAPRDADYKRDIELAKQMGFNGVRKHQKIEDPRFYYWCDRLGLLVWAEMGSCYDFNDTSMANFAAEWPYVIRANFNHPSIIAWVPFNESWGIAGVEKNDRPQEFVGQIVAYTRGADPTRHVIDNSGWHHVDTDIIDIHEYSQDSGHVAGLLSEISPDSPILPLHTHNQATMSEGFAYQGQPIIVSEYGGIALASDAQNGGWGYGEGAISYDDFIERFKSLTSAIKANQNIAGFCYTQLYDVEQEVNGLFTYDRLPKVEPEKIAAANTD